MRERLVFGTARLSGGPYAVKSRGLIEQCLKAGIRQFDTAPGYGLGAAECLLGDVLDGVECVSIHTKVGSPRPGQPTLLGWAKWLRNLAPSKAADERMAIEIERFSAPPAGNDYSAAAIARSLETSRRNLRRDRLDLVLLHEAEPVNLAADSWKILLEQRDSGRIGQLGFAHFGPPQTPVTALVAQTAPLPDDFLTVPAGQPRIFHSVRKSLRFACQSDPRVAAVADELAKKQQLDRGSGATEYLLGIQLLARAAPDARMIFATNQPAHLAEFVDLLDRAEEFA